MINIKIANPVSVPNMLDSVITLNRKFVEDGEMPRARDLRAAADAVVRDVFPAADNSAELVASAENVHFKMKYPVPGFPARATLIADIGNEITGGVLAKLEKNRTTCVQEWGVNGDNAEQVIQLTKDAARMEIIAETIAKRFIALVDDQIMGHAIVSEARPTGAMGIGLSIAGALLLTLGANVVTGHFPFSDSAPKWFGAIPLTFGVLYGGAPWLAKAVWNRRVSKVNLK